MHRIFQTMRSEGRELPAIRRALLALASFPLKEAAIDLGITEAAVSRVLSGQSQSQNVAKWFAERFRIPLKELFPDSRISPSTKKIHKKSTKKSLRKDTPDHANDI